MKKIDDTLGRSAAVTGDVHRYGFPRTDLNVTLDGVTIKPALALGGWTAFKPVHGSAMMMGDLVLLESEITPVMTAAIENELEITAIHNHVLRAHPATFYMHVSGHGDPVKLANALHTALAASKTPLTSRRLQRRPTLPSTRQNSTVSSASKANPWAAFINSVFPNEQFQHYTEYRNVSRSGCRAWSGHRHQFPTNERWQSGDNGGFRSGATEVNPVIHALLRTGSKSQRFTATCSTNNRVCFSSLLGERRCTEKLAGVSEQRSTDMANAESVGTANELDHVTDGRRRCLCTAYARLGP